MLEPKICVHGSGMCWITPSSDCLPVNLHYQVFVQIVNEYTCVLLQLRLFFQY